MVSIIIPTYNRAEGLKHAVASVFAQSYTDWELLIADDGSTDQTTQAIQPFLKDARVRHFRLPHSGLPAVARNAALRQANGDCVALLDSDDFWLPEKLAEQMELLDRSPHVGLVCSNAFAFDGDAERGQIPYLDDEAGKSGHVLIDLLDINFVINSTVVLRRAVLDHSGLLDESPWLRSVEDYDLWLRIAALYEVAYIPRPLAVYRTESPDSIRNRDVRETHLIRLLVAYSRLHRFLGSHPMPCGVPPRKTILKKLAGKWIERFSALWSDGQRLQALRLMFKPFSPGFTRGLIWAANSLQLLFRRYLSKRWHLKRRLVRAWDNLIWPGRYLRFLHTYQRDFGHLRPDENKTNVLCMIPYIGVGGAERVILNVAGGVNQERFCFHLTPDWPRMTGWDDVFQSRFRSVAVPRHVHSDMQFAFLCRLVRQLNIRLVLNSNSFLCYGAISRLRARFPGIRIVDIVHSEQSPGVLDDCKDAVPYLDRRVCISRHLQDHLLAKYRAYGFDPTLASRVRVIHNGIDLAEFTASRYSRSAFRRSHDIPDRVRIVTYVGRLSREKRPHLFVEAARSFAACAPEIPVRFVVAGDGAQFEEVRKAVMARRLTQQVLLTGMTDRVGELLAATDVLVIPSSEEGIPFVAVEALAMGVPVISTNVGAVYELVRHGVNGFLIDPGDRCVEECVERLHALLTSSELYDGMAAQARPSVENEYSLETMSAHYEALFNEVLET